MGEIIEQYRPLVRHLAEANGATDVRIFGSFARGTERADSDLDLLINLKPGGSLLDLIAIKQAVEDLLNRKVDVVTEGSLSPYIRHQVLQEAVSL
jgi:predicted nucleotidyltransferase